MVKVIIFDFDGVIIDSEKKSVLDNIDFLKENGIDKPNIMDLKALVGTTDIANYEYMSRTLGISYTEAKNKLEQYIEFHPYTIDLIFPEVELLLRELYQKYKLVIASNSPINYVIGLLQKANLYDYFDFVISGKSCVRPKPDPAIYIEANKRCNVSPEECLVIEDSTVGIIAGKRAGLTVVGRYDSFFDMDLTLADYIITNLSQIKDILKIIN